MRRVFIKAIGWVVGACTRRRTDPVFEGVVDHGLGQQALFHDSRLLRVCGEHQDALSLAEEAVAIALQRAALPGEQIQALLGWIAPYRFESPCGLHELHHRLCLGTGAGVWPSPSNYANFIEGLQSAARAIQAGDYDTAMVVCATAMSKGGANLRALSGTTIGDGAAAVVVSSDPGPFEILGFRWETHSKYYGVVAFRFSDAQGQFPSHWIDPLNGAAALKFHLYELVPASMEAALRQFGIDASQCAMLPHQPAQWAIEHWRERVRPAQCFSSFLEFGNLTSASVPVNLGRFQDEIAAPYAVLHQLALGFRQGTCLLKSAAS